MNSVITIPNELLPNPGSIPIDLGAKGSSYHRSSSSRQEAIVLAAAADH
jgi:hypothetical protein